MTITTHSLNTALIDLLALHALRDDDAECNATNDLCDFIANHDNMITRSDAALIMTTARMIDPTLSDHGAMIRDTLRDYDLIDD